MIINYLPSVGGEGEIFPPIPDKAHFTYTTYKDGEVTKAFLESADFTDYSGESITIPDEIDGYHIGKYSATIFQTSSKLGRIKNVYMNNTDYIWDYNGFSDVTIFKEPIQNVYCVYFNAHYSQKVFIAGGNELFNDFKCENKNNINMIWGTSSGSDFTNTKIKENPFPFAQLCKENAFENCYSLKTNKYLFTYIGSYAFLNTYSLIGDVKFNSVVSVDSYAFEKMYCENIYLESLESCTNSSIFSYCWNLKNVYLPKLSVISGFGDRDSDSWFYKCDELEHIYVTQENYDTIYNYLSGLTYAKYGSDLKNLVTVYTPGA